MVKELAPNKLPKEKMVYDKLIKEYWQQCNVISADKDDSENTGDRLPRSARKQNACAKFLGLNSNRSCQDRIVISVENPIYQLWKISVVLICIVSSYTYAYIAAFAIPGEGSTLDKIIYAFEFVFVIDMMVCKYYNLNQ